MVVVFVCAVLVIGSPDDTFAVVVIVVVGVGVVAECVVGVGVGVVTGCGVGVGAGVVTGCFVGVEVGVIEVEGGLEDEGVVVGRLDEEFGFVCETLDTETTNIYVVVYPSIVKSYLKICPFEII